MTAANARFLGLLEYRAEDLIGRNHSCLVEPSERDGAAYREVWHALRRGEPSLREVRRRTATGREVWLREEYVPVRGRKGQVTGVMGLVTDVTEATLRNADFEGKVRALDRSQGIIEFDLEGRVLDANANFLAMIGYGLEEVKGRHHSLLVDPAEAKTDAYAGSGRPCAGASSRRPSTAASPRAAATCGSRPPTIRSRMPRAPW